MKLISVIVPAYNIEKYIGRCLDSIIAQTYTELEIIAVDDGSTDDTGAVLDGYAKKDQRIKVIHQENLGLSGARNSALKVASGDYIGFVDGDDHIEPAMYETMINSCLENEAEMAICAYRQIGEGIKNREFSGRIIPLSRDEALDIYICDDREFSIYNSVWSRLFKKEIVLGEVFPQGRNSEDIIYTTKAMCKATKCVYVDLPLYDYTASRPDSIMNVKLDERRFSDEIPFLKEQLGIFKENVSEELYFKAVYHYCRRLLFYHNDFKERGMKKSAEKIAKIINEDRPLIEETYGKPFVKDGDKKRMKLFLDSPGRYYLTSKVYEDTVVPLRNNPTGSNSKLSLIGNTAFYAGVILEVLIMFLDKADYINPYEGWMFRISFLLFLIKVICTKYSFREYLLMAVLGIISFISYKVNTKDELVRFVVFLFAMKNIDLKHALKSVFKLSVFAMILLAVLSLTGLLGDVFELYEGYGFKEGSRRICLGLGSSNTFAIMIWALMLLGIYLYHEKMKWWHYAILTVLSFTIYLTTLTRTTLAVMLLTVISAFVMQSSKTLQRSKVLYAAGVVLILAFVGFSIWVACVSNWHLYMPPFAQKLNDILTGRIENVSRFVGGGGYIYNWSLFSSPVCDRYFDMGLIRLFYWYGTIPASTALLLVFMSIRESYRKNDYMGYVMIMMFAVFTVVEAHIVSVYIARNYLMFLVGSCIFTMLAGKKETLEEKTFKEEYFWRFYKTI
ncbi:MAG: glycosyltransferase [Lachnospiraceae bacterium]|nr:glycosyltransferase [Lachnospiraceae bacterium]